MKLSIFPENRPKKWPISAPLGTRTVATVAYHGPHRPHYPLPRVPLHPAPLVRTWMHGYTEGSPRVRQASFGFNVCAIDAVRVISGVTSGVNSGSLVVSLVVSIAGHDKTVILILVWEPILGFSSKLRNFMIFWKYSWFSWKTMKITV